MKEMSNTTTTKAEFLELLHRRGHRPAKGKHWTCSDCPKKKTPALSVDTIKLQFFCHRCLKGGGVGTLRKELGITVRRSEAERRAFAFRKGRAQAKANAFLADFLEFRQLVVWDFQAAYDVELLCRDIGASCLRSGREIPEEIIPLAFIASTEKDLLEQQLCVIDDPAELPRFIELHKGRAAA